MTVGQVKSRHVNHKLAKKNHILTKISPDIVIGSHHLIGFQLFQRLSVKRIEQMDYHNYRCSGKGNMLLIPHKGSNSISAMVACHYGLPLHSGAHDGFSVIEQHFKKNGVVEDAPPVIMTPEEKDMYDNDKKGLDATIPGKKPVTGYHKVVSTLFLSVLKKLKCRAPNRQYLGHLSSLSEDICSHISKFELLLSDPGFNFAPDQGGCKEPDCTVERTHGIHSNSWPDDVLDLYVGKRLKTLEEL